ncbi:MAG: TonB-dependent receptor, partial [Candidatus Marinimicrobia bacterium]|nr:TonB-dependent receptor [Candidatus Neomarinimicrobiota bacterium]
PVKEWGYLDEDGNFDTPKAEKKWRLMPRLGIAYPITDNIKFHFSYGHFLQYPEYKNMYQFINQGDPSIYGNSFSPFPYSLGDGYIPSLGNPNIKPEITVAYETGIHWRISNSFVLNTTVFYKDMYDYHASTIFFADPVDYAIFLNQDYGNSRGIEFNLKKLFSHHFSFDITYTFSRAVGNATDEYSHWWEAYLASVYGTYPSLKTVILDWNQPHTFNFNFNFRHPRGWGLNFVGNIGSGLPYTPTDVRGQNLAASNSGSKPVTANIDMKAYKDIKIKPLKVRLFMDITNFINRNNILTVFSNSGQPDENLNPNASIEWEDRPYYYGPPRHIEAGIEISFD